MFFIHCAVKITYNIYLIFKRKNSIPEGRCRNNHLYELTAEIQGFVKNFIPMLKYNCYCSAKSLLVGKDLQARI